MRCLACHSDNLDHRRFCAQCGARLPTPCVECGFVNEAEAKFCGGCGCLRGEDEAPSAAGEPAVAGNDPALPGFRRAGDPERRHLTVMFCDMVASSALAERLDPEDLRELIYSYQNAVASVIFRYEGFVAKYMGDGILIYFGYPNAHEDDAERALRAGLAITAAVAAIDLPALETLGERLAVRIGVATGLVVVGDIIGEGVSEEKVVIGTAPNVAARLQHLAPPNSMVVADSTAGLVSGRFLLEDLGEHHLRGISSPLHVFKVLATDDRGTRFEATHGDNELPPMIARQADLQTLEVLWQDARQGRGALAFVSGEAGIGKSRLVSSIKERVASEGCPHLLYQCSPYYSHTAFHPFISELRQRAGIQQQDDDSDALAKLERLAGLQASDSAQDLRLLAELLGMSLGNRGAISDLSPERKKILTRKALAEQIAAMAGSSPLLVVVEDLQWSDPSTIDLFGTLAAGLADQPVLLLVTSREPFPPVWSNLPAHTEIPLEHLARDDVRRIITRITGGKPLPAEVEKDIVDKTDGIPLFVEELVKTVMLSDLLEEQEDGYVLTGPLPSLSIPATLQDSLLARLARLVQVKEVAQIAAVIGREFGFDLLRVISQRSSSALLNALNQLVQAEIITTLVTAPHPSYLFRHALVQDAAYQSLLRRQRQQLHGQVAQALVDRLPEHGATRPELLAHHYTEAGMMEQAVAQWAKAGRNSLAASANAEAVGQLNKALGCLQQLPAMAGRDEYEIDLSLALGTAYRATRGFSSKEAIDSFTRAITLGEGLSGSERRTEKLTDALRGLYASFYIGGQLPTARDRALQILDLGRRSDAGKLIMLGYWMTGCIEIWSGEFSAAQANLEQAYTLYDPKEHPPKGLAAQIDPGVSVLIHMGWNLWFLGRYRESEQVGNKAIATARTLRQPYALAMALLWAAYARLCMGKVAGLEPLLAELDTINHDHDFTYFRCCTSLLRGQIDLLLDNRVEGQQKIDRALAGFVPMGAGLGKPWALILSIAACARHGLVEEGRELLQQAYRQTTDNQERQWLAELHRLDGELNRAAGDAAAAEESMRLALSVARDQQALALELRAATSLARLRLSHGNEAMARELLSPVVERFAAEPESSDLAAARALLAPGE